MSTKSKLEDNIRLTHVIYALYAGALIAGATGIVAVVLNYMKRDDVDGTWLATHFRWQVRTFWFSLAWSVIGFATFFYGIGVPIMTLNLIWYIYRMARGWFALQEGKPMPAGDEAQD